MATTLSLPDDPLYLQSWIRVFVDTDDAAFDDVVYRIDPPETGCTVSYSRDGTFDTDRPHVILVAGGMVGSHLLVAIDRNTGAELATREFSVTDTWTGEDGPSKCVTGRTGDAGPNPTFGGGVSGRPQNYEVHPQRGGRRVAVVILETSDSTALSDADAAALRDRLREQVFTGVPGANNECAAAYFKEVSHGRFWLADAGVVGPLRLPDTFKSYGPDVDDASIGTYDGLMQFAPAAVALIRQENQALAILGQGPLIDLLSVESILFVMRTVPPPPPSPPPAPAPLRQAQWPSATRPGGGRRLSFQVDTAMYISVFPGGSFPIGWPVERTIECVCMAEDWESLPGSGTRTFQDTVAHELAHNLGLPDEYAKAEHLAPIVAREPDKWTLMTDEDNYPHLSTVEKLMLGWTRSSWVRLLNFAVDGPLVGEEIVLSAAELGEPAAGTHAAVELRRSDGTNYYFEYRSTQSGQFGDQALPENKVVLATEFLTGSKEPPDRRFLLLIRDDGDGDDGTFGAGDDYREQDTTTPEYPNDLLVEVVSTDDATAKIKVTYGDSKPDPKLTNFSEQSNWTSPDIKVQNTRSALKKSYENVPWEGHPNKVLALVRNVGTVDAPGVTVNFWWKNYALTNSPEFPLGSQTLSVPADGQPVTFTSKDWVPPISNLFGGEGFPAHYCLIARIEPYAVPSMPAIKEVTPSNNEAQSNYTHVNGVFASPSSRDGTGITLYNDTAAAQKIHAIVGQTNPLTRTYLEHAWVTVGPAERREVAVMTEWAIGDDMLTDVLRAHPQAIEQPNDIRLTGVSSDSCAGSTLGGASISVSIGTATEFRRFDVSGSAQQFSGRVVRVSDGRGVNGTVLVTIRLAGEPESERTVSGPVRRGDFGLEAVHGLSGSLEVQAFYLSDSSVVADCDSWVVTI